MPASFFSIFLFTILISITAPSSRLIANANSDITKLKTRQPNWRMQVLEVHPGGRPKILLFSIPGAEVIEIPVQLQEFDSDGTLIQESDVTVIDNNLVPHGPSIHYNCDGTIAKVTFYQEGTLDGPITTYYSNGSVKTLITINNGILSGPAESYYPNGQIALCLNYQNGKLSGPYEKYYPDGKKERSSTYKGNVLEGETLEWHKTGGLKSKKHYVKGLLHSHPHIPTATYFYPDQKVKEIQNFTQNQPCGMHCKYFPSGKKSYELSYTNGRKHGIQKYFNTQGTLIGGGQFEYNKLIGIHRHHDSSGALRQEAHYDATGTLMGPIKCYNRRGDLISHTFTVNGKPSGKYQEWNSSGDLIKEFNYDQGEFSGIQQEFYPGAHHKRCISYFHGKRDGKYEEWSESGQKLLEVDFEQGIMNGKYCSFYPNGNKKSETHYVAGALEGELQTWYENGQQKKSCFYVNGNKEGICKEWDEEGSLQLDAHFVQGLPEGIFQQWYSANKPKLKAFYQQGKLEGHYLTWFQNGSLHEENHFANGLEEGIQRIYFPKEETQLAQIVSKEMHYLHGKLHGPQRANYASGEPKALIHYSNGLLDGSKTLWGIKGNIIENSSYSQGNLHGKYFVAHPSGKEIVYHYKDGILEGLHEIYYPQHEVFEKIKAFEASYKKGQLDGEAIEYNEIGTKIASIFYVQGKKEGISALYAQDGHLHITAEFKNNKQEGPAREYSPTGQVLKESHFVDNQRDGKETLFFENGKPSTLHFYQKGKLHGLSQSWNQEGILIFEAEYKEGKRHGKCNKYDHSGNLILLQTFVNDKLEKKQKFDPLEGV